MYVSTVFIHCPSAFFIHTVSFTPKTAVLFPGSNVTFMCNDSNKLWIINSTIRKGDDEIALINGITSTGPMNTTLIITESANNTLYGCGVILGGRFVSDSGVVYVASTYVHNNVIICYSRCMYVYILVIIQYMIYIIVCL